MTGPMSAALAAVMALTALYCAGRLVLAPLRGRVSQPGVDLLHVVMGAVMAAALLGVLSRRWDVAWVLGFVAAAFWFLREALVRAGRVGWRTAWAEDGVRHSLQHGLGALGMLAMLGLGHASYLPSIAGRAGMSGMAMAQGSSVSLVAPAGLLLGALAFGVIGLGAVDTVRLGQGSIGGTGRPMLAPRCAAGCRIAMSLGMGLALLSML
jgi:hypothetical protein